MTPMDDTEVRRLRERVAAVEQERDIAREILRKTTEAAGEEHLWGDRTLPERMEHLRGQANRPEADDHPGGPLSRAERVLLSHLKNRTMEARTSITGLSQFMGAIPGAQKIEAARLDALSAIDRLLLAMKTRKQGAPALAPHPALPPSEKENG